MIFLHAPFHASISTKSRRALNFPHLFKVLNRELHPSYCFYALLSGILMGIPLSFSLNFQLFPSCASIYFIPCILVVFFIFHHSKLYKLFLALLLGFCIGNFRTTPYFLSSNYFQNHFGETITLSGQVASDPLQNSGLTTLSLDHLSIEISPSTAPSSSNDSVPSDSSLPLAGTVYVTLANPQTSLERSDYVTVNGKIGTNFGTFVASFYRADLKSVDRSDTGDIFARLKAWFSALVRKFIPDPEVELGLGYLVGEKSGLSESFSETLRAVGMAHVVVASGAHLGIIIGLAKKLFGKISKFAGLLFSLLLVGAFAATVGFTPSMTRAALVTTLSLPVGYIGRRFTPMRLLILVATITLLLTPINFLHLGWQLSFASFFGLLVVTPLFQKFLYGGKKPPWLAGTLITSLSTSLICAPILIYNFGSISFLSLLANLIILPTLPYVMALVFLTGLTSFLPTLAQFFSSLATFLLRLHISVVEFLGTKTSLILEFSPGNPYIYIIYLPLILLLGLLAYRINHRQKSLQPP